MSIALALTVNGLAVLVRPLMLGGGPLASHCLHQPPSQNEAREDVIQLRAKEFHNPIACLDPVEVQHEQPTMVYVRRAKNECRLGGAPLYETRKTDW